MKKILVLDVDETLLNMEPLFFLERFKKNYKDYEGVLIFDKYYLSPRPNVKKFLSKVKNEFILVAFSVVSKEITNEKLSRAGLLDFFDKVYGKEDLEFGKKSIKKVADDFNVEITDTLAIDDVPEYFIEKENVIKITPWYIGNDKNDNALSVLLDNLKL